VTVQAERPTDPGNTFPPRRRSRAVVTVFGVVVIVAAVGVTAIGFTRSEGRPANPVLGRPLQPLSVYRVELPSDASDAPSATMQVPDLGRPGDSSRLRRAPTFKLHVEYAHVRQVAGKWQVMVTAPEGRTFNVDTTRGQFYDVLVKGQAVSLFFVGGTQGSGPDHGTNFAFGSGPNSTTMTEAVALAHTLTTSVHVG
jgi:hypothetical protein